MRISTMLCTMLLAASPLAAQNQSKTKDDGCRPIPIGGGVAIWPEDNCSRGPYTQPLNMKQMIGEQKTAGYIRVPSNCRLVEIRVPDRKNPRDKEATITLKCVRPILLRDDYGRSRN